MNDASGQVPFETLVVRAGTKRLSIMISSTSLDLPVHRGQVKDAILRVGHYPLAMEHGTAKSDADAISFSLAMVDQADIYIGIFAERYGHRPKDPKRNPKNLSVTELEYRRAVERKIPIFVFLASKDHLFTTAQMEPSNGSRKKLEALKKELKLGRIVGFFSSDEELRGLVVQALNQVRVDIDQAMAAAQPPPKRELPQPPEVLAVPAYVLTNTFIGRSSELGRLDAWAKSSDAIMVVEGIGGLGKSAVTWEWMNNRAPAAIPGLAGRVWWSFYEKGTSMVTFVRFALAYITGQDPEALRKDVSHYERGQQLLTELRRRPYLLVLDGFERVLTAYHRLDKAQIPDDRVDERLRECTNPPDGELLTQLLRCGPSKILLSTRLFPSGLEDRGSRKPIPGVTLHHLNGLSRPDALALMRDAGVTGDEEAMLAFADQFDCHSLLLKIVCGMIADYRRKPYDFDAWRTDPNYGDRLKLSEIELKQRYTHILHYALAGLNELTRKLLCRIAVISENATYDTLAVLNPFLPPKPGVVEEPSDPSKESLWRWMSDEDKQKAQEAYQDALQAYRRYQDAVRLYPTSPEYRRAVTAFDAALKELENRGLLQWDRDANTYEMHPVVRGHAAELLEAGDRTETFHKVRTHFESLPPDDPESATELVHLAHSLEIYRCLVGAGMLDEAATFYQGELSQSILFHVGAYTIALELLKPLFRNDFQKMPFLTSTSDQSYILSNVNYLYNVLCQFNYSLILNKTFIYFNIKHCNWNNVTTGLFSLSYSLARLHRRAESLAALSLARKLSEAVGDTDGITIEILFQMAATINQGYFAEAESFDGEFRRRPQPPIAQYRPSTAEYWRCLSQCYQGKLVETEWQSGFDLAVWHRNIITQYRFLALRAEWDLAEDRPSRALEAIDQALQITNKCGTPKPDYHDLRAWALARVGRTDEALAELQDGEQQLFAAEAYRVLGDREQVRECTLNAYHWAWGEGPPYIHWYTLKRSRALLRDLGEPEPQLPLFDPSKVPPIPFEAEIRAAIQQLKEEREKERKKGEA